MKVLSSAELNRIAEFDIPTLSNGLDRLNVRPLNKGFMDASIQEIIPKSKTYIGYAATAKISCDVPAADIQKENLLRYYGHVKDTAGPTITLVEDIDPVPVGALWGEVNVLTHMAIGCVAVVTNGGIRDLNELDNMDFGCFGSRKVTARAYLHVVEYGGTVQVGGIEIKPMDLICADRHGVIIIPEEAAPYLADACMEDIEAEKSLIENIRKVITGKTELDMEALKKWRQESAAYPCAVRERMINGSCSN